MPRREEDPLALEIVDLIAAVVVRYHEEYEEAAARLGLTEAQARALALIAREPLPMRRIANVLRCEPSNVTGVVDRLETRGLVERRPSPGDRRIKMASLTERGSETAAKLGESLSFAREPLAELTPQERATLRDLLRRMLAPPPPR